MVLAMQYIHIVWLCGRIIIGSNFICLAEVISNKDFISFLYSIFFLIFGAISPSGPALSWIITEDMRQPNFLGAYTIFLGGFVASPHPHCSKAKVWKKAAEFLGVLWISYCRKSICHFTFRNSTENKLPLFTPGNFCKIVLWHPLEIWRSRSKTYGNSAWVFLQQL